MTRCPPFLKDPRAISSILGFLRSCRALLGPLYSGGHSYFVVTLTSGYVYMTFISGQRIGWSLGAYWANCVGTGDRYYGYAPLKSAGRRGQFLNLTGDIMLSDMRQGYGPLKSAGRRGQFLNLTGDIILSDMRQGYGPLKSAGRRGQFLNLTGDIMLSDMRQGFLKDNYTGHWTLSCLLVSYDSVLYFCYQFVFE